LNREGILCAFLTKKNWLYLENGERYGQDYYKSLIASGIPPIRWNENHLRWM